MRSARALDEIARSLELEEILQELGGVIAPGLYSEAQEYRRMAGIALEYEPEVLRPGSQDSVDIWQRLRSHVGKHPAVGAVEAEVFALRLNQAPVAVNPDWHRSIPPCTLGWRAGLHRQ